MLLMRLFLLNERKVDGGGAFASFVEPGDVFGRGVLFRFGKRGGASVRSEKRVLSVVKGDDQEAKAKKRRGRERSQIRSGWKWMGMGILG